MAGENHSRFGRGSDDGVPDGTGGCGLVRLVEQYLSLAPRERGLLTDLEQGESRFARGEIVRRHGDSVDELYVVREGWLVSSLELDDGRRTILQIHHPGDIVGLPDLALPRASSTLTASGPAILSPFPKSAVSGIIIVAPRLTALLLALSARDQSLLIDLRQATARMPSQDRLLFLYLSWFARLQKVDVSVADGFYCPLTQTDVGDTIGLTNVSVSKAASALENDGFLERDGQTVRLRRIDEAIERVGFLNRFESIDTDWFPAPDQKTRARTSLVPPSD